MKDEVHVSRNGHVGGIHYFFCTLSRLEAFQNVPRTMSVFS